MRDHEIFDDQNVGNHKMTTDNVFILFKKTDLNIILGGKVFHSWARGNSVPEMEGS